MGGHKLRFVLVHGAWHGAWCWEPLSRELSSRHHEVVTPDLPAQGDDPGSPRDATSEAVVARIAEALRPGSTLVGHSLGGFWSHLAAARVPERVANLVYLTTLVPLPGQTWADTLARCPELGIRTPDPDPELGALPPPEDGVATFYHACPPDVARAAVARLRPLPLAPLAEGRAPQTGFGGPALAVACAEDRVFPVAGVERCAREAGVSVVNIAGDHSPFYSNVRALADALEGSKS